MKILFSYKLVVVLLLWVSPLIAQEYRQEIYQTVPLLNAGFEAGGIGPWTTSKAVLDRHIRRSGKSSLKLENHNPADYELIRQKITVQPGELLRFGGWVKGENVSTEELWREKGAGIFIQGYSADGKYIAGEFPPTLSGTFDWREIKGVYKVPAGVNHIYFGLFIRNRNTGTAWFDDLWLEKKQAEGIVATLHYPNYRGITTSKSNRPWEVKLTRRSGGEAYVRNEIKNWKGEIIHSDSVILSADLSQAIRWRADRRLSTGEYIWEFKLVDSKGNEMQTFSYEISVRRRMPKVYVDQEGFVVKNRKRFFPVGIYLGEGPKPGNWASSEQNLDKIAEAGFNTVLSYYFGDQDATPEYFKLTRERQLAVVYNLKDIYDGGQNFRRVGSSAAEVSDEIINKIKQQPNLLAWYINDELGLGKLPAIQQRYDQLKSIDPDHPAYQVNDKTGLLPFFYNSSDIIGTDPYPVANSKSLRQVSDWTQEAMKASKGTGSVWQVLQLHDLSFHNDRANRPPTLDEMRNMSYQALIGGSKGLFYFAYHWLFYQRDQGGKSVYSEDAFQKRWPDVRALIAEINEVLPAIVGGESIDFKSTVDGVVVSAWRFRNQTYILLANPDQKPQNINILLPKATTIRSSNISSSNISQNQTGIELSVGALGSGVLVIDAVDITGITSR